MATNPTRKQKTFIERVRKTGDITSAYKESYDAQNMRDTDIKREAIGLLEKPGVFNGIIDDARSGLVFLIVNGLKEHATSPDIPPATRVKALELLGKMTDVGLYRKERGERADTSSSVDIEARIIAKLKALLPTLMKDSE